jgi:hypothetical protein
MLFVTLALLLILAQLMIKHSASLAQSHMLQAALVVQGNKAVTPTAFGRFDAC